MKFVTSSLKLYSEPSRFVRYRFGMGLISSPTLSLDVGSSRRQGRDTVKDTW